MPFKSDKQRKLFYAAAGKKGGLGGLDQETAKMFIKDAKKQKLPKLSQYIKRR